MAEPTPSQRPRGIEMRPNYFDGQYLKVDDFQGEQHYHIDRQRRPFQFLHVSGILHGLGVTPGGTSFAVTLAPGSAIDAQGRQILLQSAVLFQFKPPLQKNDLPLSKDLARDDNLEFVVDLQDLSPPRGSVSYYLTIAYGEDETDKQKTEGSGQFRRWHERPRVQIAAADPEASDLPLAKLTLTPVGLEIDPSPRRYSGVNFPNGSGSALTMRSQGSQVQLSGSLSVQGQVGIGTDDPKSHLSVAGAAAIGTAYARTRPAPPNSLIVEGRLGIGTADPAAKLEISGTAGAVLRVGQPTATGTTTAQVELPGDVQLKRWGAGQYAYLQTIDGNKNNSIGLVIRTQNAAPSAVRPTINDALTIRPDGTLEGISVSGTMNVSNIDASGAVGFGTTRRQMLNLWNAEYGIGIQDSTQYFRTAKNFAWYKGGSHNNAQLNAGSNGVTQMVIKDGNVGIGTTDPAAKLEISGTDGTVLRVGQPPAAGTTLAKVELPGDVQLKRRGTDQYAYLQAIDDQPSRGIGLIIRTQNATPNNATPTLLDALAIKPDGDLSIHNSISVPGAINFGTSRRQTLNLWNADNGIGVQDSTLYFRTGTNFAWYKGGSHNNGELNPGTNGVTQMVIKDGKVGIGTSNPDAATLLDVAGVLKAKSYKTTLYSSGGVQSPSVIIKNPPQGQRSADSYYSFPDLTKDIFLAQAANVLIYYQFSMDGYRSHMVTRLKIGIVGLALREVARSICGSYHDTAGVHWDGSNFWMGELEAGNHRIVVEYRTPVNVDMTNNPAGTDWHNRMLQVLVLGSV